MRRFLRYHALQSAVAVALAAAALLANYHLIRVARLAVVRPGVLYRCSQPRDHQWRVLPRYRVTSVVDLRPEAEDPRDFAQTQAACREAGAEMLHIPMSKVWPSRRQLDAFLERASGGRGAVLVHCQYGEKRTGTMVAAYRVLVQGWPVAKAQAEMARYSNSPEFGLNKQTRGELRRLIREHRFAVGTVRIPLSRPAAARGG
jgi:protein tyrosine/serine phosphatase